VCRQCSSGLQAIATVAASIKAGYYTIGLAGGVETMSAHPMTWEGGVNPAIENSPKAQSCLLPMGITSENVATKFGLNRCVPISRTTLTYFDAGVTTAKPCQTLHQGRSHWSLK
jgi:acetyl-CoA acetyltransferase